MTAEDTEFGAGRDPQDAALVGDRYQILREIARGGMCDVFVARHVVTGARVALKRLRPPVRGLASARARLLREAWILGSLRHPGLVAAYDAGTCPVHGPFIAMEMIDGRPLDGVLAAQGTLGCGQAVAVVLQILDALAYVHRHGFVHRDIKPANVIIATTPIGEKVEIVDFGIARDLNGGSPENIPQNLTRSGEILGTVSYMAPEQLLEVGPAGVRADVYSVGVLLYECLTGAPPFSGGVTAVMAQVMSDRPPKSVRALRPEVPAELDAVIRSALSMDPASRPADCDTFAAACRAAVNMDVPALRLLSSSPQSGEKPATAGTVKQEVNQRRFARAPFVAPVRLVRAGGVEPVDGRTEDISEGGVLVVVDALCEANQAVELKLPLPMSGLVVSVPSVTRWIRGSAGNRAIGVEFTERSEMLIASIREYVSLMNTECPRVVSKPGDIRR